MCEEGGGGDISLKGTYTSFSSYTQVNPYESNYSKTQLTLSPITIKYLANTNTTISFQNSYDLYFFS